jgi:hypothetical protein
MKRLIGTTAAIFLAAACGQSTKAGSGVPIITSFTVAPTTLPAGGGSITLAWTVTGATTLSINGGVGTVTPVTTGSISGTVTATATFTLTATNASGISMANATVTVGGGTPTTAPTINSFTLSPPTLAAAGGGTASWNVTGATSLTLGGPAVSPVSATPLTVGNTDFTADQSAIFTLFATNSVGTTVKNAVVTVGGDDAPEFDFTAGSGTTYTGTWGFDESNVVTPPPGSGTSCTVVVTETAANLVTVNVSIDTTGTYTDWSCSGDANNAVTPNLITSTETGGGFSCTVTGDASCGSFTANATGAFGFGSFDDLFTNDSLVIVWNFTIAGATTASCNGQTLAYAFVVQPPAP